MIAANWLLGPDSGSLQIHTGTAGRAAKMGHRLTIAMQSWEASVQWSGDSPTHAELTVQVDSLDVLGGEGGVTPLSGPEKGVATTNALKSLDAKKYPTIHFSADDIAKTPDGYRMTGTVEIHGKTRPQVVDLKVAEADGVWTLSTQVTLNQTDFGVKPYSLFMGTLKVADEVTIDFAATHPQ